MTRTTPIALITTLMLLTIAAFALTACNEGGSTNAPQNTETTEAPADSGTGDTQ